MSGEAISLGEGRDAGKFETRDVRLAAALMAVGIRPVGDAPVHVVTHAHRSGDARQFHFSARSECGRYETRALVQAWREGGEWVARNADHPFAYAMCAMQNHCNLLDYVKSAVPQVFLQRGRSVAMLPLDASAELEARVLGKFSR